jgi:ribosomal protein S18 acetylase RimI-like enzyme
MEVGVKFLNPTNSRQVQEVSQLHARLLPESPVVQLGLTFLESFYYKTLVADRLVWCELSYHDGVAAGFIAYTDRPKDFMSRGLRHHWPWLAMVLAGSVARNPARGRTIFQVLAMMRGRKQELPGGTGGEILSFGVLPAFRGMEFIRRTGRRISMELFDSASEFFRRRNIQTVRMLVAASNREALLFYHGLGCTFEPLPGRNGKTVQVTYTFASDADLSDPNSAIPHA